MTSGTIAYYYPPTTTYPIYPSYPTWTFPYPDYCQCQRCPHCGKVMAPGAPRVTWTTTSGDCGSVTQKG